MSTNGLLDADELDVALGYQFTVEAAWALNKLADAFEEKFGYELTAAQGYRKLGSPSDDPYLSPATQWSVWNRYQKDGRPTAAYPGTSNHGLAKAVDLSGRVAQYGTLEHNWFLLKGRAFGWFLDTVAGEPWHADFRGLTLEEEEEMENDMPLSDADLQKIADMIKNDGEKTRGQLRRVRTGITNVVKAIGKNSRKRDEALADDLEAVAKELDKE